jgi:predicted phosphoribosyltransferase
MGNRILSRSSAPFLDRREAGKLLGKELLKLRSRHPVVLGIPRGGVVTAAEVAAALSAELDIVLARKIGAPSNPELAIGSVSEDGHLFMDEGLQDRLGVPQGYVERERERQMREIERRTAMFRAARPKAPLKGRVVVVTDDGLATGATMQAALWACRREHPAYLVAAVPVAPEETLAKLAGDADEFICLQAPPFFSAVGQFYRQFDQVEDEEVLEILKTFPRGGRGPDQGGIAGTA